MSSPMPRIRHMRQVLIAELVTADEIGPQIHITDKGCDVEKPSACFTFETAGHAYTVTITEDR